MGYNDSNEPVDIGAGVPDVTWQDGKIVGTDAAQNPQLWDQDTKRRPTPRIFTFDDIREFVLWARRNQMMTGPDVADFLGISVSRVNEVERGEKPGMLPGTRKKITENILNEDPNWRPTKRGFPPLQSQEEVVRTVNHDDAMEDARQESSSFSQSPEGEGTSPKPSVSSELTGPGPKITGQMISIEVDEDDILEITIQIRRRKS